MIGFTVELLMYLIIPASLLQPTAQRLFAAIVFTVGIHAYNLYFSHLVGYPQFLSAILLASLIMVLTSGINPVPKMVVTLHRVCIASVLANIVGCLLWYFYISSVYYNMMFILIYGWAFFTLIKKDRSDNGNFTLDSWRACFRFSANPLYSSIFKHKSKV